MTLIYLTHQGELRRYDADQADDAKAIDNLMRKGWERTTPPDIDPATHRLEWNGEWVIVELTDEEKAALARKVWTSSAAFWGEFTDSEKLAILASTIPGMILLREELRLWTGEVWSDDARVQQGLAGLVAAGLLTAERQGAILKKA